MINRLEKTLMWITFFVNSGFYFMVCIFEVIFYNFDHGLKCKYWLKITFLNALSITALLQF